MDQEWFEMKNIRRRNLEAKQWIPLRCAHEIEQVGRPGSAGFLEDRLKVVSLAVPTDNRAVALALDWNEIGIAHDHAGCVDSGQYVPADRFEDAKGRFDGVHLVLRQNVVGKEQSIWHLHQDFVLTLRLKREADRWVRPEEDSVEVARLTRNSDGSPARLEVRPQHLRDYLCARGMGLVLSSFWRRSSVTEDCAHISWAEDQIEETDEHYRWVGLKTAIHEGGTPYGQSAHVIHARRTDMNPEDDVPVLGPPADANLQAKSWTKQFEGRKLYRVSGELWLTEWLDPASQSPIVRGDDRPSSVSFIVDPVGNQVPSPELIDSGRWLWFRPTVVRALIGNCHGSLQWHTRDMGWLEFSSGHSVDFGVNELGLVNTYAKAIALLPDWQQREWAAHNVLPDGKLSEELQAAQIDGSWCVPTVAPEARLAKELTDLQELAAAKLKIKLFRQHTEVATLMPRLHRFRATSEASLFELAKDLMRVTAEDMDAKQLKTLVDSAKDQDLGSLKSLETVLAIKIGPKKARSLLGPLVGVNKLRSADAHLKSSDLDEPMKLTGVDRTSPFVVQGRQLLCATVDAVEQIRIVIDENW